MILKDDDDDILAGRKLYKDPSREAENLNEMSGREIEMVEDELLTPEDIAAMDQDVD